ncbi:amidohydrolase [Paraburkholderia kirstenboschensis]
MIEAELLDNMVTLRRALHAHPETAFEEVSTARLVASLLREYGFEVTEGVGKTGVVGTLRRGSGPALGLRADMDALPRVDHNELEHRSQCSGKMHAYGHDGHTAMLLGAAASLSRDTDSHGTVHLIFQPAEEVAGGGRGMVEDGLFERFPCNAVFGLHNWPGLPLGHFAIDRGPMMASFDSFEILVDGKGSHAAMPEEGIDALVCASHVAIALQTIVSRRVSPKEACVLSVTQIHGGEAWNVLPDRAVIRGTVRCFDADVQELVRSLLHEIGTLTAQAHAGESDAVLPLRLSGNDQCARRKRRGARGGARDRRRGEGDVGLQAVDGLRRLHVHGAGEAGCVCLDGRRRAEAWRSASQPPLRLQWRRIGYRCIVSGERREGVRRCARVKPRGCPMFDLFFKSPR